MVGAASAARWLLFPIVLGGAMALAIGLIPLLGVPVAVIVAETAALASIAVAEHRWPFRTTWNRSHGDIGTDTLHALISGLGTTRLALPLAQLFGAWIAAQLSAAIGLSLWPTHWPLPAQLALALVIAELPQYWLHRSQHEHDALWRFHAVHHSAPRLYWLNAARFHPVDIALLYAVGYVPLVALGCPETVLLLFACFDAVFGMLQHCNADVRLGPLNYVFSMAEPHRWHHSRVLAEANANYGSNLIVWDHVFGTFFLPRHREPPAAIGLADHDDYPTRYLGQLAAPFRRRRPASDAPRAAA